MNIGQKIRQRRKELGMTLNDVSCAIGVSRQTLSRYETGKIGNIPTENIEALAKALMTSPASLMGWDETNTATTDEPLAPNVLPVPKTYQVPRMGQIACGAPLLAEENIEGYDAIPDYIRCDFTLVCRGDSMINARIFDGDLVCIRQQPKVENGEIAAVMIDGNEATLKRVYQYEDRLILEAENPLYRSLTFRDEEISQVRIIGKATHFISAVR